MYTVIPETFARRLELARDRTASRLGRPGTRQYRACTRGNLAFFTRVCVYVCVCVRFLMKPTRYVLICLSNSYVCVCVYRILLTLFLALVRHGFSLCSSPRCCVLSQAWKRPKCMCTRAAAEATRVNVMQCTFSLACFASFVTYFLYTVRSTTTRGAEDPEDASSSSRRFARFADDFCAKPTIFSAKLI